jgi:hypothetical protein
MVVAVMTATAGIRHVSIGFEIVSKSETEEGRIEESGPGNLHYLRRTTERPRRRMSAALTRT